MKRNSIVGRKSVRRVVHRSGTSKNLQNICHHCMLCILVGVSILILWFTITIHNSAITSTPSSSTLLTLSRDEPIWTPYQLDPTEVLTGHFSEKTINHGIYQYQQISNMSSNSKIHTDHYRIFFPINYQSTKSYNNNTKIGRDYDIDESLSTYLITQCGNKGHDSPNQDRSILIHDDRCHRNEIPIQQSNDLFVAALFDGHGDLGHVTSHVAVTELPLLLLQSIQMIDGTANETTVTNRLIPNIIKDTFHAIDTKSIIAQVPSGGSTAVLVLHRRSTVYIASAGDSTAYLIQWHATINNGATSAKTINQNDPPYVILKSAVLHKPSSPLERKRIEDNGGTVYIPRHGSHESSRVIYESLEEDGKVVQTGLAMSRSLGDATAKELRVVISDPDIVTYTFPDSIQVKKQYFVILASDGIMDVTDLRDIIVPLGMALYDKNKTVALRTICDEIVQRAIDAWNQATGNQYRDDISLVVHKIW